MSPTDVWDRLEAWVITHDLTVDLATVWSLAVGFGILALVELATWWSLRSQHDETSVGRALRPKKLAYAVICAAMSSLYSLTLFAYYQGFIVGIWGKFGIRVLLIVGIVAASVLGIRFIWALRTENWGRPDRGVTGLP